MVDTEPIVTNSDICRAFGLLDTTTIKAVAIIQDDTIIGYYLNTGLHIAAHDGKEGAEEEKDFNIRLESALRSVGRSIISSCSSNQDIFGKTLYTIMHSHQIDISAFLMPNSASPVRVFAVASIASADCNSVLQMVIEYLNKIKE